MDNFCKGGCKNQAKQNQHSKHVTVEEREKAAEAVIKIVQQQAFPHEIKSLQGEKDLPTSSNLFSLDPIWSEGLSVLVGD